MQKLLIANRGEIAARIARTARRMGIATVAVFSDADAGAPYVREADEAVRIGAPPSSESYLRIDRLLEAAARTGADAVHPGFGFLAERAAFARAASEAGLVFVGPPPEVIERMGDKRESKRLARAAGVPVIGGRDDAEQSTASLAQAAREVGLPVLIKASAGGGGKGMQVVRDAAALDGAIESARRVAESAFGDGTLLVEKYLERPRHVEIQILGDAHGNVVHLRERECSIQRRHQKIVEESPSVAIDDALRTAMGGAAVALAQSLGYVNAGTVEMLVSGGEFYFLEVNTRLQVEHPVTETILDLDLVELQIRVARGERLPFDQAGIDARARGAAIECRLYAEDADQGFMPQAGTIARWELPEAEWLRVDAGVASGSEVSIHYDPMLAKVIARGGSRAEAILRMRWALERAVVFGVTTNLDFLLRTLEHPAFVRGELSTHFVADHLAEPEAIDAARVEIAAIAAALADHLARRGEAVLPSLPPGWRNNRFADPTARYLCGAAELEVAYRALAGGRFQVRVGVGEPREARAELHGDRLRLEIDGHVRAVRTARDGELRYVRFGGRTLVLEERLRFPDREADAAPDACVAPLPGKIVRVLVAPGDAVTRGQPIAILEAMKMEHTVSAPHDGSVRELRVSGGEQVDEGALLAVITAPE